MSVIQVLESALTRGKISEREFVVAKAKLQGKVLPDPEEIARAVVTEQARERTRREADRDADGFLGIGF